MEARLKIAIPKTKLFLYGKLRGSLKRPLLVLVHGLTGYMDEKLIIDAARWFERKGFATFRYDLYGYQRNARQLMGSTLRTHASDLNAIVAYFERRGAQNIFAAGHSFGGPTILLSRTDKMRAVALWDPAYKIDFIRPGFGLRNATHAPSLHAYMQHWGFDVLISERMAAEARRLDWDILATHIATPTLIVLAGAGGLRKASYIKQLRGLKRQVIIPRATHQFVEDGAQERLYQETHAWFKKFLSR